VHDVAALHAAAERAGLTHVGVCDHFVSTKMEPGRAIGVTDIAAYVGHIREVERARPTSVRLLASLEINFSLIETDFSFLSTVATPDEIPWNWCDYLLFESVNDAAGCGLGLHELLKLRHLISVPVGLAHPDLDRSFSRVLAPELLVRTLTAADIF